MPIERGSAHGRIRYPNSFKHLDMAVGPGNSALAQFLYPLAYQDVVFGPAVDPDFTGASINTNIWTTNAGTGATAFAVPATLVLGGTIQGATGTNATASNRVVNLYGAPVLAGNNDCCVEARFRINANTAVQIEFGFIDTMTTITTAVAAVTSPDGTPSFAAGAGDVAVIEMLTTATNAGLNLITLGSASLNAGARVVLSPTTVPTNNAFDVYRVVMAGTTASAYVNGTFQGQQASAMTGATLVRPWFFVAGTTTTNRIVDIDYCVYWQDRTARTV